MVKGGYMTARGVVSRKTKSVGNSKARMGGRPCNLVVQGPKGEWTNQRSGCTTRGACRGVGENRTNPSLGGCEGGGREKKRQKKFQ